MLREPHYLLESKMLHSLGALSAPAACRWSPHVSATGLCHALDAAQKAGMANDTLFVDVGAARAYQTLVARRYGHPVLALECRHY